jgi:hypothetical protein
VVDVLDRGSRESAVRVEHSIPNRRAMPRPAFDAPTVGIRLAPIPRLPCAGTPHAANVVTAAGPRRPDRVQR